MRPWVARPAQLHHQGMRQRQRALLMGGQVRRKGQIRPWVEAGHQGLRLQQQQLQMSRQARPLPRRAQTEAWARTMQQRHPERRMAAVRAMLLCNV